VEGSGWALLVYLPEEGRLAIITVEKHQNLLLPGAVPLLALDVWEHAYYLKYKNKRADFIKNWWNLVNWKGVEYRFEDQCGCCCSG
jgi:Fe-Mn family superoxide dismutase